MAHCLAVQEHPGRQAHGGHGQIRPERGDVAARTRLQPDTVLGPPQHVPLAVDLDLVGSRSRRKLRNWAGQGDVYGPLHPFSLRPWDTSRLLATPALPAGGPGGEAAAARPSRRTARARPRGPPRPPK